MSANAIRSRAATDGTSTASSPANESRSAAQIDSTSSCSSSDGQSTRRRGRAPGCVRQRGAQRAERRLERERNRRSPPPRWRGGRARRARRAAPSASGDDGGGSGRRRRAGGLGGEARTYEVDRSTIRSANAFGWSTRQAAVDGTEPLRRRDPDGSLERVASAAPRDRPPSRRRRAARVRRGRTARGAAAASASSRAPRASPHRAARRQRRQVHRDERGSAPCVR